jgi:excisionase family DNA binding protein
MFNPIKNEKADTPRLIVVDELLTPEELAERLKIPLSSVYKMTHRGEIPVIRIGRLVRFRWDDILDHFCNGRG